MLEYNTSSAVSVFIHGAFFFFVWFLVQTRLFCFFSLFLCSRLPLGIRCFVPNKFGPTAASALKFLRAPAETWARARVETLYLELGLGAGRHLAAVELELSDDDDDALHLAILAEGDGDDDDDDEDWA